MRKELIYNLQFTDLQFTDLQFTDLQFTDLQFTVYCFTVYNLQFTVSVYSNTKADHADVVHLLEQAFPVCERLFKDGLLIGH
jgi:hypothetical protein